VEEVAVLAIATVTFGEGIAVTRATGSATFAWGILNSEATAGANIV